VSGLRQVANRAAARVQLLSLRLTGRWLGLVLLIGLVLALLGLGHRFPALQEVIGSPDLAVVLKLVGVLLLVLIPTAGIYSVVTQYAFWEGWLDGLPAPAELFALPAGDPAPRLYLVYLDGIHQSELDHPPRVSAFLELLEQQLPPQARLLRGLETYTVMPAALREDRGSSWFWRRLFALQEHHPNALVQLLCAVLVQANNVIKVGISSDRRYGPILNYELALKISLRLAREGFHPDQGCELVLLGYSGGAEMAMGVADYLRRLSRAPVRIITVCGVFSANQVLDAVSSIITVVGTADPVAAFGRIAYPGRLPWMVLSNWNQALSRGQVQRRVIPSMSHNGSHGPFAPGWREAVVAQVVEALAASPGH
jgi:hypothetical protein